MSALHDLLTERAIGGIIPVGQRLGWIALLLKRRQTVGQRMNMRLGDEALKREGENQAKNPQQPDRYGPCPSASRNLFDPAHRSFGWKATFNVTEPRRFVIPVENDNCLISCRSCRGSNNALVWLGNCNLIRGARRCFPGAGGLADAPRLLTGQSSVGVVSRQSP